MSEEVTGSPVVRMVNDFCAATRVTFETTWPTDEASPVVADVTDAETDRTVEFATLAACVTVDVTGYAAWPAVEAPCETTLLGVDTPCTTALPAVAATGAITLFTAGTTGATVVFAVVARGAATLFTVVVVELAVPPVPERMNGTVLFTVDVVDAGIWWADDVAGLEILPTAAVAGAETLVTGTVDAARAGRASVATGAFAADTTGLVFTSPAAAAPPENRTRDTSAATHQESTKKQHRTALLWEIASAHMRVSTGLALSSELPITFYSMILA